MSKAFLDTNVLAYACDSDQPEKQAKARELLRRGTGPLANVISTQVLQEFYVTATRKLGIEPLRAKDIMASFRPMGLVTVDADDIGRAIDGNILWQVSFWDALIVVSARKARCDTLYTEDLNSGQVIDSVRIVNPFV